ncbi:4'-phosphopantetheinyl transferase family protein [Uliginosibacterium gangwonense]|uniref:4'-phosphopantetheinyl transferase family protein n=1 Tax=Uliginosibacterium gangwonense TaxID=392736 RepID=UPI000373E694|nr:4'-phosphopantetheinyl transferase superfamily protein [Uliginosibacterium gangwonense]
MSCLPLRAPTARPTLCSGRAEVWLLRGAGREGLRRAAHRQLEEVLADYLGPASSPIAVHGRNIAPQIVARWQGYPLYASLSYAGDCALVALCPDARVGVDIVYIEPQPDQVQVARDYLDPQLAASFAYQDAEARSIAFARAWAEMEARSKCLGLGLEEWSRSRAQVLARPQLKTLIAPPGYVAVAAVF